jgi:hypothetical protein
MNKDKIKNIGNRIAVFFKHIFVYTVIAVSLLVGFIIGFHYKRIIEFKRTEVAKPEFIRKHEVSLAIDESKHVLIINKKDGKYFILQDSVGTSIFSFYAKDIWKEHVPQPVANQK